MTLLEQIRAKIRQRLDDRARHQGELDEIVGAAEARGDGTLTDEEATRFQETRDAIVAIDEQLEQLRSRETELAEMEERRRVADEASARYGDGEERRLPDVHSGNEPLTYRNGGPHSFFSDAFRATRKGDFRAAERLQRHQREMEVLGYEARDGEQRAVGTGQMGGLVVPQYLVDEFAPVLRNGRAFANAVRRLPLPEEGMNVVVPRANTGVTVTSQATEGAAVSNTDVDYSNDLTVPVRTVAGQQDVSRQALERGTPGLDRLIYDDLVAAYAAELDRQLIAGTGASGEHKGVLNATGVIAVTYTDTTPTVPEIWPKLADARQQVGTQRKLAANMAVMAPRRWGWFEAALDTTNRPLFSSDPQKGFNLMGEERAAFGEGQVVGAIQALVALVDGNIPTNLGTGTNEDRIIVLRRQDCILWEEGDGMPRELRFEETDAGNLQVKLVVYGYSAFTAERYPQAKAVIAGTGLATPTF